MSGLGRRVLTGTTLAVLAAALLWLHSYFPAGVLSLVVVTLLALGSVWELDRMGSFRGRRLAVMLYPAALVGAVATGVGLGALDRIGHPWGLALLYLYAGAFSWPSLALGHLLRIRPPAGTAPSLPVLREVVPLAVWLLPPLFSIVLIDRAQGTAGLVVLIVLAKAGDNAAFFVGRAFGKRHPFPRISPGKTVAGCVASLVAGIAVGAVLLPLTLGERTVAHAALGALVGGVINVAAQAGDLSESWVKRRAGVKDSSALLGPSGGVLDVIDSLLLAAPVALLAWSWAYPVPGR